MGYRTLRQCVDDLQHAGHLVRLDDEVDAHLEAAEIHRRVYQSGGPAILFNNVRDCRFAMVSNLFGTMDRARYMFRDSLDTIQRLIELKIDPTEFFRRPTRYATTPWAALRMRPRRCRGGAGRAASCALHPTTPRSDRRPRCGGGFHHDIH